MKNGTGWYLVPPCWGLSFPVLWVQVLGCSIGIHFLVTCINFPSEKSCHTSSQVNVWFSGANFRRACIDKAVVHLVWKVKQKSCSFKCIREKEPRCFCNCYEEQQNFQLLSSNFVLRDLISAKLRKVSSKEKLKLLLKLALFLPFFLHFLINLSFSFIFLVCSRFQDTLRLFPGQWVHPNSTPFWAPSRLMIFQQGLQMKADRH